MTQITVNAFLKYLASQDFFYIFSAIDYINLKTS